MNAALSTADLQSAHLDAANTLRESAVDRTDWKGDVLPLLFFRGFCDVRDEETTEASVSHDCSTTRSDARYFMTDSKRICENHVATSS